MYHKFLGAGGEKTCLVNRRSVVQTRLSASFVARNLRKHGKKNKINKRQDSHPSAEKHNAYYAEVMQFSY